MINAKNGIVMKMKLIIALALLGMLVVTCNQTKDLAPRRILQINPAEVTAYHPPVSMQIGWFPYHEDKLVRTGKDEWKVVKNEEEGNSGAIPQILIHYPHTTDSIWLDMNIDNALLGKLIKHTLMTQVPIERPFAEYFEVATCSRCHPSHIKIDFE